MYKRIRPAHLYPALTPMIPTPRHPSYPSGHALQSRLIALAVSASASADSQAVFRNDGVLQDMAFRIAENREIAGVHYPDDSAGSIALSVPIFDILKTVPSFIALLETAQAEWAGCLTMDPPPVKPEPPPASP